jgi:hypothetical protein
MFKHLMIKKKSLLIPNAHYHIIPLTLLSWYLKNAGIAYLVGETFR